MKRPLTRTRSLVAAALCAATLAISAGPLATTAGAATTVCPASAGNARFVRFIYFQILGRCADGPSATYWTHQLDMGMSRFTFAEAIDHSNENLVKNNADPIYQETLGRPPTAGERKQAVESILAEFGDGKLAAHIASLDEFYAMVPGANATAKDQAWLTAVYTAIVDRPPDPAGRTYFTGVLHANSPASNTATRLKVASVLERSNENARGWTTAVFFAGLNRPPDAAGFAFWYHWLIGPGHWQTFRMWTHILSSDEGYRFAQTQPNPTAGGAAARSTHRLGAFLVGH